MILESEKIGFNTYKLIEGELSDKSKVYYLQILSNDNFTNIYLTTKEGYYDIINAITANT